MPALLYRASSVSPGVAFQLFLVLVSTLFSLVWVFGASSASGVSVSPWQVVASVERILSRLLLRFSCPDYPLSPLAPPAFAVLLASSGALDICKLPSGVHDS